MMLDHRAEGRKMWGLISLDSTWTLGEGLMVYGLRSRSGQLQVSTLISAPTYVHSQCIVITHKLVTPVLGPTVADRLDIVH